MGSEEKPDMAFVTVQETTENIRIETGLISVYISRKGQYLVDSLLYKNVKVGENLRLICTTQSCPKLENISLISFVDYQGELKSAEVERVGYVHTVIKLKGVHKGKTGREWLPFVVRLYFYAGSEQVKWCTALFMMVIKIEILFLHWAFVGVFLCVRLFIIDM